MISLNSNVASIVARSNLLDSQRRVAASYKHLSTGKRIVEARDDAAGLAISEQFQAQIRSLAAAERNAHMGKDSLAVYGGALAEASGILVRMRELSVQSLNETVNADERQFLQSEFSALRDEIDRIAYATEYNGKRALASGTTVESSIQVGIGSTSNDVVTISFESTRSLDIGTVSGLGALGFASSVADISSLAGVNISTMTNARLAMVSVDQAISDLSARRSSFGVMQNRADVTISNLQSARANLSAANSRIRDTDIASESASLVRNQILLNAGAAVMAQANAMPAVLLTLLEGA